MGLVRPGENRRNELAGSTLEGGLGGPCGSERLLADMMKQLSTDQEIECLSGNRYTTTYHRSIRTGLRQNETSLMLIEY